MIASEVTVAILRERARQEREHPGRTPASREVGDGFKLAILVEEVGEVAKCLCEPYDPAALASELVQVAAVAQAWLEAL